MRSAMHLFVVSLAFADLGILSVNFPIAATRALFTDSWLLGSFVCLFMFPTSEAFFGASIWSIQAIAIERYRNIVGSQRFIRHRSTKHVKIAIPLIWIASFLVSSVPMFVMIKYDTEEKSCLLVWLQGRGWHIAYYVALTVLFYILPLLVITVTYVCIARDLQHSDSFRNSAAHPGTGSDLRAAQRRHQNSKAKRVLTPLVVLFAVSMLPLSSLRIVQFFWAELISDRVKLGAFTLAMYGVIINSSLNPLIYCIVSQEFRQGFREMLTFACKKKTTAYRQDSPKRSCRSTRVCGSLEDAPGSPPAVPAAVPPAVIAVSSV